MKKQHILIAVPTLSGELPWPIVQFIMQAIQSGYDEACPFIFSAYCVPERWPHSYARNLACRAFLESGADKLWFVDADMMPTPRSLHMLTIDADIVSGMYMALKKSPDKMVYEPQSLLFREPKDEYAAKLGFMPDYPADANDMVHEIAAAGTGCMLIKRRVLEDKRMWLPTKYVNGAGETVDYMDEYKPDNEDWAPPIFRFLWKPSGCQLRGEDLDFCARARANGYKIIGDHNAPFGHIKKADILTIAQTISRAMQTGKALAEQKDEVRNDSAA